MTKQSARKAEARAYAAKHGVPYTEALRAVAKNPSVKTGPGGRFAYEIQRAVLPDLSQPMPLHVLPDGTITYQDFWRGDPQVLIGFVSDPDQPGIDLYRQAWVDGDPDAAVGMYAVCRTAPRSLDDDGRLRVYFGAVIEVTQRTLQPLPEVTATFRSEVTATGVPGTVSFDVADVLPSLSDVDIETLRRNGWAGGEATRLLFACRYRGNDNVDAVAAWLDEWLEEWLDDWSDEPYVPGVFDRGPGYTVALDAQQVETYLRSVDRLRHLALPMVTAELTVDGPVHPGEYGPFEIAPEILEHATAAQIFRARWEQWTVDDQTLVDAAVHATGDATLADALTRARDTGADARLILNDVEASRWTRQWARGTGRWDDLRKQVAAAEVLRRLAHGEDDALLMVATAVFDRCSGVNIDAATRLAVPLDLAEAPFAGTGEQSFRDVSEMVDQVWKMRDLVAWEMDRNRENDQEPPVETVTA